jgi:hypothetical protein
MITVLIWKKTCIVLFIKRLDICPWTDIAVALRCLCMGKIDVITYKYVIMSFFYTFIEVPVPRQESKQ